MNMLHLLRHAKSSAKEDLEDHARPLSQRGRRTARLGRLHPRDRNVLLIGHNPGLHELALALAEENSPTFRALASGKFPTAACVSFRVPADWSVLGSSRHELIGYVTPESLSDEDE